MGRLLVAAAAALVLAAPARAQVPLRSCFVSGAHGVCGKVVVPEDRAKPDGRTIALRVMVLKAVLPHPRPDPLFYVIGGPGLPSTHDAQAMQYGPFATINQDHDIVLVDQRGTGASNALACPKPPAFKTRKQAVAWVRSCTATARLGVVFRAERGDYGPLAAAALQPAFASAPQAAIMPYSVMCDEPWARWSLANAAADAKGTYLAKAAVADATRLNLICAGFPKRAERAADWHRPHLDVPLLALVGADDPQNPVRNISGIKEGVPRARLVVVPGYAHVVGNLGCIPFLMGRFLAAGSLPKSDLSCAHAIPPPAFRLG